MAISSVGRYSLPFASWSSVHNTPSYEYMKMWRERGTDYVGAMGDVGVKMKTAPKLVGRILKTESAMKQRGLVPFVHAMPAGAKVPRDFYHAMNGGGEFFQYVRSPFSTTIGPHDAMVARVPAPSSKDQSQKSHLLSMSYALISNTEPLESAASWGFNNHGGGEAYLPMADAVNDLDIPPCFKDRGRELIRQSCRLPVGTFLVLGVPRNKLSRWVYDSKPYNIPTGRNVETVVDNPEPGTVATMVISKEVLDPNSGLVVVEANNENEVERFCQGLTFKSPSEIEEFKGLLGSGDLEKNNLDEKVKKLIQDFRHWQKTGEFLSYEKEETPCQTSWLP